MVPRRGVAPTARSPETLKRLSVSSPFGSKRVQVPHSQAHLVPSVASRSGTARMRISAALLLCAALRMGRRGACCRPAALPTAQHRELCGLLALHRKAVGVVATPPGYRQSPFTATPFCPLWGARTGGTTSSVSPAQACTGLVWARPRPRARRCW